MHGIFSFLRIDRREVGEGYGDTKPSIVYQQPHVFIFSVIGAPKFREEGKVVSWF